MWHSYQSPSFPELNCVFYITSWNIQLCILHETAQHIHKAVIAVPSQLSTSVQQWPASPGHVTLLLTYVPKILMEGYVWLLHQCLSLPFRAFLPLPWDVLWYKAQNLWNFANRAATAEHCEKILKEYLLTCKNGSFFYLQIDSCWPEYWSNKCNPI